MIVRETDTAFVMTSQHDHAHLSGQIASQFKSDLLTDHEYVDDFIFAVYEHDRSWIPMDAKPIWNEPANAPYSFTDFPLLLKLICYKYGLDEIESNNPYAGLLCSMHYTSFFKSSSIKECIDFRNSELRRQSRISNRLDSLDHEVLTKHFRILQFCDRLSLYVCLNEPGIRKHEENTRYIEGFVESEMISDDNNLITAGWLDSQRVNVQSFPFKQDFTCTLRHKTVPKVLIADVGIAKAYRESDYAEQEVIFCE